jgi:hypothetical protein
MRTPNNLRLTKYPTRHWGTALLTGLGLTGMITGCNSSNLTLTKQVNAQNMPTAIPNTPVPTSTPEPASSPTATPTRTPVPTNTPWATPTPWPTSQPWQPSQLALPTLAPVPLVTAGPVLPSGNTPVNYAPPDGVDVFGSTILRWTFHGQLAPDEFFDIKIKPAGSNNSVFVDWTKSTEYALHSWSGWQPGLYQWQIGIVKGYRDENGAKHFIADTGRDSESFVIKWQGAGVSHTGTSTGNSGGNNNPSGGS